MDAVEFHDVYAHDREGNPALMVEEVTLEVPNDRVHEITEDGTTKDVMEPLNVLPSTIARGISDMQLLIPRKK